MVERIPLDGRWSRNGDGWLEQRFEIAPMVGCLRYWLYGRFIGPIDIKLNGMLVTILLGHSGVDVTEQIMAYENTIAVLLSRTDAAELSLTMELVPCDE